MQIVEHPRKPRAKSRRGLAVTLIVLAALAGGGAYYWYTRPDASSSRANARGSRHDRGRREPRRADLSRCARHHIRRQHGDDPQPDHRHVAVGQLHRGPGGEARRHARGDRSAPAAGDAHAGAGQEGAGPGAADLGAEGSRALCRTGQEGFRHAAEPRPAAGQGRSAQGHDRRRPGRDRQRADAALLRDDRRAVRRPRRLPPGRCRQHRASERRRSAHRADADQAVDGDLHAAAKKSRRRARGDAARRRDGARLRPGRRKAARERRALADRQPDRPD